MSNTDEGPASFSLEFVRWESRRDADGRPREICLEPMEVGVCTMPDGSRFVIAESNSLGGVCDDCQQWHPEKAETIAVYRLA